MRKTLVAEELEQAYIIGYQDALKGIVLKDILEESEELREVYKKQVERYLEGIGV